MSTKVEAGAGGRGSKTTIERRAHPDSHFKTRRVTVEQADDGSFVVEHSQELKREHDNSDHYLGGYREPKKYTAADHDEMMTKVAGCFGKAAKAKKG